MPLCKAVTDRRYRRNWSVRFIDALYELQVPSRDCHVGLRPPRNDNSGVHAIFTMARFLCRCSAGRDMSLPYNNYNV